MNINKHLITALSWTAILCMLLFATGCDKVLDVKERDSAAVFQPAYLSSGIVATNAQYSLEWDADTCCVLLRKNGTDNVWSTIPYKHYLSGETDEDLNSPLYINYVNNYTKKEDFEKAYTGSVSKGNICAKEISNGIEVMYHFEKSGITVPVQYCLREDSLAMSVDFSRVVEGEEELLSVSLAPYLCATENNTADSYLFVPSGSGALMFPHEDVDGTRTYVGDIYGDDGSRLVPEKLTKDESVRLPVFGVRSENKGLVAIVEQGEAAAAVNAEAGSRMTGYTTAYVTFYARGYDVYETQVSWAYQDYVRMSEMISAETVTVGYYPLSGENANYIGMAERYRRYLQENGGLEKSEDNGAYSVYVTGGAQVQELFMGIPYSATRALTTFAQAQQMLSELTNSTGVAPVVQMKGFGESGLTPGKVAGGFDFSSVFGSNKYRLALENVCKQLGITLFTDFDAVYFGANGGGYSTLLHVAKSASLHKVQLYYQNKAFMNYDREDDSYFLLKRAKLSDVMAKLRKAVAKKNISGVSLSTLGSVSYSDYSDPQYAKEGQMLADVKQYIAQFQESGVPVATEKANAYAAAVSDCVLSVPTSNGGYATLDKTVPFYQMVFKGYKPLYSTAVNTSGNTQQEIMLAVQSGTSLGFSLVGKYDMDFSATPFVGLNVSDYEGNKDLLIEIVAKCKAYYNAISGQTITNYYFLENGVTVTTFSNGVRVYANHQNSEVTSPVGELGAYGFVFELEGAA